ncbi:TPA: GDSL family lipase [Candidatus Sumerlaeota bacterium]|nr:GDSL family lipase [Candidatus Sumerlaeota bacterium]
MWKWVVSMVLLMALSTLEVASAAQGTLPVEIKPTDPNLYYTGRFDMRDAAGPRCQWSGCMVTIRFRGTDLQAGIQESGDNYLEVIVDNTPRQIVHSVKGANVVDLARGLSEGEHVARVMKRTEAMVGMMQFTGFYVNAGGKLLKPQRLARKIEVIGDSISCGYGNEGANEKEHFAAATENAWLTYGAITARELGAEYVCVAWSGKKMWPDKTIPAIYDLTLPNDSQSTWNFASWQPDVVLINLATNDFGGQENPDEIKWTGAYKEFLRHVRKNYPNAVIYIASGTMMQDQWPPDRKVLSTLKRYMQRIEDEMKAEGETKLHQIHFGVQNAKIDGMGSDWHPSVKTQQKMARQWIETLTKELGWNPVTQ